jgi:hypothetical protein
VARRLTDQYPPLDALGRTLRRNRASLSGARRFAQGEGLFVFADSKDGIARVAEEVYLPPSAYRQLGNFLDQNAAPGVVGFRLSPLPQPSTQLPELGEKPLARFATAASQTLQVNIKDEGRSITLQSAGAAEVAGWDWAGSLHYEHFFTLEGGLRIPDEACVQIFARESAEAEIEIAIVTTQSHDREAAVAWLTRMNKSRWLPQPIVIPQGDPGRLAAIKSILDGFGADRYLALRSPDVYPSGVAATPPTRFLQVMKRAPYETGLTDLDTVIERMKTVDSGILGSFTCFLWERGRQAVVSIEVRQRPSESYARLTWKSGRAHNDANLELSDQWWDAATPVDWSSEEKQLYLLGVWREMLDGIHAARTSTDAAAIA